MTSEARPGISIPLKGEEINVLHHAVENPFLPPNFAATDEISSPYRTVIVLNFQGSRDELQGQSTLIERFHSQFRLLKGDRVFSFFVSDAYHENADRLDRAEFMYQQAQNFAMTNKITQLHIHVTGFGYGGVEAIHFMNLIHTYGLHGLPVIDSEMDGGFAEKVDSLSRIDFGPGMIPMSAVLLDVIDVKEEGGLNQNIPPSAVSVLHVQSNPDSRALFPIKDLSENRMETALNVCESMLDFTFHKDVGIKYEVNFTPRTELNYKRLHQFSLPGSHSDVGGMFGGGGMCDVVLYLANIYHVGLGFRIPVDRPDFLQVQKSHQHDSRGIFSRLIDAFKIRVVSKLNQSAADPFERHAPMPTKKAEAFDACQSGSSPFPSAVQGRDLVIELAPEAADAIRSVNSRSLYLEEAIRARMIVIQSSIPLELKEKLISEFDLACVKRGLEPSTLKSFQDVNRESGDEMDTSLDREVMIEILEDHGFSVRPDARNVDLELMIERGVARGRIDPQVLKPVTGDVPGQK